MKAYGEKHTNEGCTCSLCRSRGYRKGDAYEQHTTACKKTARTVAKRETESGITEHQLTGEPERD